MGKAKDYRVSFINVFQDRNHPEMTISTFLIGAKPPHPAMEARKITASSIDDLLAQMTAIAATIPACVEGCAACLTKPKPPGFDARTHRLRYNDDLLTTEPKTMSGRADALATARAEGDKWRGIRPDLSTTPMLYDTEKAAARAAQFGEAVVAPDLSQIKAPTDSPWGAVQSGTRLAHGIWSVSTASHGGVWVCPELLACIPEDVRRVTFNEQGTRGWFEEDADWCIPYLIFAARLRAYAETRGKPWPEEVERHLVNAQRTADGWHKQWLAVIAGAARIEDDRLKAETSIAA